MACARLRANNEARPAAQGRLKVVSLEPFSCSGAHMPEEVRSGVSSPADTLERLRRGSARRMTSCISNCVAAARRARIDRWDSTCWLGGLF